MLFWPVAALLAALTMAGLIHPLMRRGESATMPGMGWLLAAMGGLLAVALYLWLGNPALLEIEK